MSPDDKTLIALGLVVKPRGLSGEVFVRAYNEFNPSLRADLPVLISTSDDNIQTVVESARWYGKRYGVKFENIDSIDDAETLRNGEILTEMKNLPTRKPDEFFVFDLVGLDIVDADDMIFGKVTDVLNLPANDVLIIEHDNAEVLIPLLKEIIDEISIESRQIKISRVREFLT